MNQRLQQFLAAENISQAQFADTIEVARASISHVLAGRNKPGYDFIRSIADHYPKLNLDWLITGKGKMYRDNSPAIKSTPSFESDLFASENDESIHTTVLETKKTILIPEKNKNENMSIPLPVSRKIKKIIVYYDDNSYQELS